MTLAAFGSFAYSWYRWEAYTTAALLALIAGMLVGWYVCRVVKRWLG